MALAPVVAVGLAVAVAAAVDCREPQLMAPLPGRGRGWAVRDKTLAAWIEDPCVARSIPPRATR